MCEEIYINYSLSYQSGKTHFGGRENSPIIVRSAFNIHDGGTNKEDKNASVRDYAYAEQNWHNYYAHVRTLRYKDYSYTINAYPKQELMSSNDIVLADSHQSLLKFKNSRGKLNPMQADVFANPRARARILYTIKRQRPSLQRNQQPRIQRSHRQNEANYARVARA